MRRRPPADCNSMTALRRQIDGIDEDLIALLTERAGYIDRAIVLKKRENLPARIDSRVKEVVGNARDRAAAAQLDPALAETLWRELIEWSIAREAQHIPE